MTGFALITIFYGAVLAVGELLNHLGVDSNITRKVIHIGGGVVSALLPLFVRYEIAILIATLLILAVLISEQRKLFRSIHNINWHSRGAILFPVSLLLGIVIFWPIQILAFQGAMLVLGVSDGLASLVGRTAGRRDYYITSLKTYEGSFVFFISTILILAATAIAGSVQGIFPFILVLLWSFILTILEGVSKNGWDNLYLPLATGLFLIVLL